MEFEFSRLALPEVVLVEGKRFIDARGFFTMTYRASVFAEHGIDVSFVQDNYSHSMRGVLRGLHYQKEPAAQAKLVMVMHGEIFDVVVDIRRDSPNFGKWVGITLSSLRTQMLYVPTGFAHGFCALSEEVDLLYKVSKEYAPAQERGILWNDPDLNVQWPVKNASVSPRDAKLPCFKDADLG